MEDRIDLDRAAAEVRSREGRWRSRGIDVGAVTWREQGEGWPPKLKTDREQVIAPDSIGIALTKGTAEGSVVLFKGGWADFEYWDGAGEIVMEAPGVAQPLTIDEFGRVLDRLADFFD